MTRLAFEQVVIMFIMIILGFLLTKLKIIDIKAKGTLSNILFYLAVPFMIINSYTISYDKTIMTNLLLTFLISFIVMIIGIAISFFISLFWKTNEKSIFRIAMMFSNAAYMGFPLIDAIYGDLGLIYASGFVTVLNVLLWTLGVLINSNNISFKESIKQILKVPVLYAVIVGMIIFFFKIPIPNVIRMPLSLIGALNTPISMIIIGMIIATSNIFSSLKNIYLWLTVIIRLIIIPFIILGLVWLMKLFNIDKEIIIVIFILNACPSAAITSVFAIKFNHDENIAASCVVVTTLLSIISLPLFTMLINQFF